MTWNTVLNGYIATEGKRVHVYTCPSLDKTRKGSQAKAGLLAQDNATTEAARQNAFNITGVLVENISVVFEVEATEKL